MRLRSFFFLIGIFLSSMAAEAAPFYFGADLSFANEMDDCGAKFKENGAEKDVFAIFKDNGTNLVRLRLWHNPDWTHYSTLADVKRAIARAHAQGMKVLLDYHYSDDWADPQHQIIPMAWAGVKDTDRLADTVYHYTADTLSELDKAGLMPDYVQVGNEINSELMMDKPWSEGVEINWARDAKLISAGIRAVREAGQKSSLAPKVVLHIAQPENTEKWLVAATQAGVTDFDVIGFSYYPQWSAQSLAGVRATVNRLRHRYPTADVMVLETAYPWTQSWADDNRNVLNEKALVAPYRATADGQKQFLTDLAQAVMAGDGAGVIYWAPDWVSTGCRTRWGAGSTWENATLFDFSHNALAGVTYPRGAYVHPVAVTFRFTDVVPGQSYVLWGDFLGSRDIAVHLPDKEGRYEYTAMLMPGAAYRLQLFADPGLHQRLISGPKVQDGFYTDKAPSGDGVVDLRPDARP